MDTTTETETVPVSRAHAAVLAFHRAAMDELGKAAAHALKHELVAADRGARAAGVAAVRRPSHAWVAELAGCDRSWYTHAVSGKRGSFDAVIGWLDSWNLSGMPKLELLVEGAGRVVVRRVHR